MAYFTDRQAKDIWKARWRGVKVQTLIKEYGENTYRFYEVWKEEKNMGTRLAAYEELKLEDPKLAASINPLPHKQTSQVIDVPHSAQLDMFSA